MTAATEVARRPPVDLLAHKAREWWKFVKAQDLAFWSLLLYLMVEYVRPQHIFSWLEVIPLGNITLGLACISFLLQGRWFTAKSYNSWLLLFFALVIICSTLVSMNMKYSMDKWNEMLNWVIIYFFIINIVNTQNRYTVFVMVFLLFNFYMAQGAVKQFAGRGFSFADWGVVGAPGWFSDSGDFGAAMCLFIPVSWRYYLASREHATRLRRWMLLAFPISALIGVLACSSRGAQLGVAAVVLWEVAKSRYKVRALVGLAVVTIVTLVALPKEQIDRFTTAGTDTTSALRLTYWRHGIEITKDYPVLGIGYATWMPYYRRRFPFQVAQVPHNIFIQCMAELGLLGLMAFIVLILATFVTNHRTRRMVRGKRARDPPANPLLYHMAHGLDAALIGFMVSGFFVTILYYPFFWINFTMTAVAYHLARTFRAQQRRAALAEAMAGGAPPDGRSSTPQQLR